MKDQLDALVSEFVSRGILLGDAAGELEKRFIKKVLESHGGNQSRTAQVLGIHRNTLSRKIELYHLNQKPHRAGERRNSHRNKNSRSPSS